MVRDGMCSGGATATPRRRPVTHQSTTEDQGNQPGDGEPQRHARRRLVFDPEGIAGYDEISLHGRTKRSFPDHPAFESLKAEWTLAGWRFLGAGYLMGSEYANFEYDEHHNSVGERPNEVSEEPKA